MVVLSFSSACLAGVASLAETSSSNGHTEERTGSCSHFKMAHVEAAIPTVPTEAGAELLEDSPRLTVT